MGAESVCGVAKDALSFHCLGSYASEYRYPKLEYAVHTRYGSKFRRAMGVSFVWFVDEFGSAGAPLFWSVVVFGHESV